MADFSPLLVLMLVILIGFTARRLNLIQEEAVSALPAILMNIAYPALILTSVDAVDLGGLARESLAVIAGTLLITLLLFFAGLLALRGYTNGRRKPLLLFNLAVGNITYVVLPVIKAVFGDTGVYYAILHSTAQDLLIWSIYYGYFRSGGGKDALRLKKLISPCLLALAAAVLMAVTGTPLKGTAEAVIRPISNLAVPLALLYIGGVLGGQREAVRWLPDRTVVLLSAVKVLLLPFAVYGFMLLIPVSGDIRLLMGLAFAAPATLMSTVWAKQFNCDYEFSIKLLIFSTVLFLAAMVPFFLLV